MFLVKKLKKGSKMSHDKHVLLKFKFKILQEKKWRSFCCLPANQKNLLFKKSRSFMQGEIIESKAYMA